MNKAIDARHYSGKPALNICKYFLISCCAFSTRHMQLVFISTTSTCRQYVNKRYLRKKYVSFPFESHLTYNLQSVLLSISAKIICKCMSIDISFSFTYHTEHEAVQFVTRDLEIN